MPIRPIADILAEALENGAASSTVNMVRTAAKLAADGDYLARKQLQGALCNLENTAGIDPADIKSLFARCANPKRKLKQQTTTAGAASGNGKGAAADDDTVEYWAATARGSLPEPFNEWAAKAIESCGAEKSKRHAKLIPGAPGRRLLENMGQSAEWAAAPPTDRAAVIGLLIDGASMLQRVVDAALGRPGKPPPPLPVEDNDPDTLADVNAEPAVIVAAGLFYRGRIGILHGPAFGGKSTLLGNVLARVQTGRPWLGKDTMPGHIVLVAEEQSTYKRTIEQAGGDPSRILTRRWPKLARTVADTKPVIVVVDTLQYIAHEFGGLDLNQPGETDTILRPLERLAREYDCAVLVTDHEPHDDKGVKTKDRPRGSTAKSATADYVLRCTREGDVTTITPNRGAARMGIEVLTFSVDARGRRTIDRPAALPPAVMGRPLDSFAGILADLPSITAAQWREREPAIRGMLTGQPDATDRAISKSVGLPTGGRNRPAAYAFITAVKDAMLADSADTGLGASAASDPTPPDAPDAAGRASGTHLADAPTAASGRTDSDAVSGGKQGRHPPTAPAENSETPPPSVNRRRDRPCPTITRPLPLTCRPPAATIRPRMRRRVSLAPSPVAPRCASKPSG